jgi:hypothetical protein
VLDLSQLTTIAAGNNNQTQLTINATKGGRVDLSALASVTRRHQNADVTVTATGSGSEVILSSLIQFGAIRELRAEGGVIHLSPGRAAVDDVEIRLIQNGSIAAGTIEIFPDSAVRGDGTVTAHLENHGGTIRSGIDAAGTLDVQGRLMQTGGQIVVDEGSTLRVRDGVFIGQESTLLGGGMIEADVDLRGLLGIETTDTLNVIGDVSVADGARLAIAAGYEQQRGTRTGLFTLLDVTGNLTGEFAIPAAAGADSHIDRGYFLSEKLQDAERLQIDLFAAIPGDSDGDGRVGFPDFVRLADNFGTAGDWTRGDFDGDGLIQFPDFVQLADQFGNVSAQGRGPVSIPEPRGAVEWMAVALAALWSRKRRASTA